MTGCICDSMRGATCAPHAEQARAAAQGRPMVDETAARAAGWVPLTEVLEVLRDEAEQQLARAHDLPERAYARGVAYSSQFLAERFGTDQTKGDNVIETFRKKPVTVDTVLWDGTRETLAFLVKWAGNLRDDPAASPRFIVDADMNGAVYNDQEHCWVNVPLGHRVVKGRLGEFYPISPEVVAETYEPCATGRASDG